MTTPEPTRTLITVPLDLLLTLCESIYYNPIDGTGLSVIRQSYWETMPKALHELATDWIAPDGKHALTASLGACPNCVASFGQRHEAEVDRDAAQAALAEMREALTAIAKADVAQSDGVMLRKMAAAAIFNDAALRSPEAPSEPEARAQGEGDK